MNSPSFFVFHSSVLSRVHTWTPNSGDDSLVNERCSGLWLPLSAQLGSTKSHQDFTLLGILLQYSVTHSSCSYWHLPHGGDVADRQSAQDADHCWILLLSLSLSPQYTTNQPHNSPEQGSIVSYMFIT